MNQSLNEFIIRCIYQKVEKVGSGAIGECWSLFLLDNAMGVKSSPPHNFLCYLLLCPHHDSELLRHALFDMMDLNPLKPHTKYFFSNKMLLSCI